ncbi:MAG: hypothetical protein ACREOW_08825 [Thermodesulfobacteriota bacterium]
MPFEFDDLDPDLAYLLEPDGWEFAVPVTASLMLDEEPVKEDGSLETELALLITSSNGELEALENLSQELDGDENMTTASGELGHFSPLVAKLTKATGIINGVPDSLPIGGIFNALATLIFSKPSGLDTAFYRDESVPTVNHQFDSSEISVTPIPTLLNDEEQRVDQITLTYNCSPEGKGLYRTTIIIEDFGLGFDPRGALVVLTDFLFLSFSKGVTCAAAAPTPTPVPEPSPSPGPSPSPSPTPEVYAMLGVYTGNGGCGVNSLRLKNISSSGNLTISDFKVNPGDLTFEKTNDPKVFKSSRTDIIIFGKAGHSCTITCGPGNNQHTLECTMPGAVCQEVFTLQ